MPMAKPWAYNKVSKYLCLMNKKIKTWEMTILKI